jgi:hypothetical protein
MKLVRPILLQDTTILSRISRNCKRIIEKHGAQFEFNQHIKTFLFGQISENSTKYAKKAENYSPET